MRMVEQIVRAEGGAEEVARVLRGRYEKYVEREEGRQEEYERMRAAHLR